MSHNGRTETSWDAKCRCGECGTTHYVVEDCPHCADNPPENNSEFDDARPALEGTKQ